MAAAVRITETDLRAAIRDQRYWQVGHPERQAFSAWVSRGYQALGGSGNGTSVWVRAYTRDGHQVAAHWRGAPPSKGDVIEVQADRGSVPPGYGQRIPGPQDPVGRLGSEPKYPNRINPPGEIGGRPYSGHALDRLQARGLTPSVIENAVRPEYLVGTRGGLNIYFDPVNRIQVVVNPATNTVVTALPRHIPPAR